VSSRPNKKAKKQKAGRGAGNVSAKNRSVETLPDLRW